MSNIQDTANEMYEKSAMAFSGIADMAGDLAARAKIKMQLLDQGLEYDTLMKRLGEAVYEEVKLDERYTQAFSDLFEKIAEVSARIKALEDEYERLSRVDEQPEEAAEQPEEAAEQPEEDAEQPKEDAE